MHFYTTNAIFIIYAKDRQRTGASPLDPTGGRPSPKARVESKKFL